MSSDRRAGVTREIPRLRRYARALLRDPVAADDLVQDCLERALGRLHLLEDPERLRPWLFSIMHNLHIDGLRKGARAPGLVGLEEGHGAYAASPARPDARLELRDLQQMLGLLSEDQRSVLLLVGLEEMSYKETAEILGIPVGTVMSRLARGRESLRALMEGKGGPTLRRVK